jgi:hypothetical protein
MGARLALGFIAGIAANGFVVAACTSLLKYDPGTVVRPLFGNPLPCCALFLGLGIGAPLCVSQAYRSRGRYRVVALLGLALNLAPLPLSNILVHVIASAHGLLIEN